MLMRRPRLCPVRPLASRLGLVALATAALLLAALIGTAGFLLGVVGAFLRVILLRGGLL